MTQSTCTTSNLILGLDVGDRITHFCAIDGTHEIGVQKKIVARGAFASNRIGLENAIGKFAGALVMLEAGSISFWMSSYLKALGFRVHVADPRRVTYLTKDHRKNDRRDSHTLALLAATGLDLVGEVRHRSERTQLHLTLLRTRSSLVDSRTRLIQECRGIGKSFGATLPDCGADVFAKRIRKEASDFLKPNLDPILEVIKALTEQILRIERDLEKITDELYPAVKLLQQVPGVGPISATTYVLTVEDPARFDDSRKMGSYVGLCPRQHASGERDPQLGISKCGDAYLRRMLIQCAHHILRTKGRETDLRAFGMRLIDRGGRAAKKRAIAAVARKLAVLLHVIWRNGLEYDPQYLTKRAESSAA